MQHIKLVILLPMLWLWAMPLVAQDRGVIQGRVLNKANNNPVEFASVVVVGTTKGVYTDSLGNFTIQGVKPGFVSLKVTELSYEPVVTQELMVNNVKPAYVEVKLTETSQLIDEVVVRVTAYQRQPESPVSLRRVGRAEIEKSAGANRDLSKVIQSLPGVAVTNLNRNDVIVRGGGSNENRFYLDGVEIPYINHFATQGASGGVVGIINPDFVRGLNFYSGAFPASKGNALSSVLDFKQLDGNAKTYNFKATVGASDLAFTANGPVGKKTTAIVSVRRSYLQFLFQFLQLPFLPTYNDAQFKVKTKLDDKNELTFIGLGALDFNVINTTIKNPDPGQQYIINWLPSSDQWSYTVGAVYTHYGKHGTDTYVLSRNMLRNNQEKYPFNDKSQRPLLKYTSTEAESKFRYERNMGLWAGAELNAGVSTEYVRYDNHTYRRTFSSTKADSVIDYNNAIDFVRWGLFGQLSQRFINNRLGLSLGIRADAASYSSHMNNLLDQLSPRFSASYAFNANFAVNFNTGRYWQLPPYTAMGYGDVGDGQLLNKDRLRYISADHVVAGIEWTPTNSTRLTVEGFYKYYRHYPFSLRDSVVLAAKGGADFGTFGDEPLTSIGQGRAYGVEVLFRLINASRWNLLLSYTLFWSEYKRYDSHLQPLGSYVPSVWDNRQLVALTGSRDLGRNWTLGAKWRLSASTPYTPYDLDRSSLRANWDVQNRPLLNYDKFNQDRLGAFHQLDLRVDKSFYFNKWMLALYIDVQNVYKSRIPETPLYIALTDAQGRPVVDPADPTRYQMQKLSASAGTILPTIGLIAEF